MRPGPTPGVDAEPPRPHGPRPPLPLIFSVTVTGVLANTLVTPAIPDILDDLDVSNAQAGLLVSAAAFPGILMAPLIGLLADRYGRRRILVPCLVVFGVAGGLAGLAPGFGTLLVARLAQGIGAAGLINLAVTIIGDHWDGLERARIIGRNSAVLTIALAILPLLGGGLTEIGGWRLSFAPYPIALVTALFVARTLPSTELRADGPGLGGQLHEAVEVVRERNLTWVMVTGFVMFFLIFGLFLTVLPVHLEEQFGFGPALRGVMLSVPAITSTIGALLVGRTLARAGRRAAFLVGSAVFAIAFVVIGLAPVAWLVVAAALLYGLAEGTLIPTLQDVVAGSSPTESRGAVVALWVGGVRTGQTLGPLSAGVAMGAIGTDATFVVGGALAVLMLAGQAVSSR